MLGILDLNANAESYTEARRVFIVSLKKRLYLTTILILIIKEQIFAL